MSVSLRRAFKSVLIATTSLASLSVFDAAMGQQVAALPTDTGAEHIETVIVTSEQTTRSSVVLAGVEAQKLLPGVSPLKAIETLPGVLYETADPWGNNEQNESLFVHGFSTQQLGYTMDGVPLGDQQYGNYNGLSVSRAVSSENVQRVTLSSGAGALGVASTSNLGGAIETFSSDPHDKAGGDIRVTGGSYDTMRLFGRYDFGDMGDGNSAYISVLHHDARAWDFDGHQRGNQANAKFVHDDDHGKLTAYADWQYKVEPNEDATNYGNAQTAGINYFPYTRSLLFPNLPAALAYVNPLTGAPPAQFGNNFTDYHSAAQREDFLTYVNYDWRLDPDMTWYNQVYFHHNTGRGIVAGPVNQAGLPALFAAYFPGQNLVSVFGGTGYEARTTEYRINRFGERSTFNWALGDHQIEAGIWYERNASSTARRWYPFSAANDDLTPYDVPRNPAFTQYDVALKTDDVQLHLQDQWHITPELVLQAGIKASLQTAGNQVITQQLINSANPPAQFPTGSLTSNDWFLPQVGAVWDATDNEQLFFNIQKNMRQFIPYAAGSNFYGASPWSLGSQDAFNVFKATAHPETSWAYEAGGRTHRDVDLGPVTAIEGQVSYYHVDFSNRLLNVAAVNFINPNAAVLVNVGGVTTDGADVAATFHFGDHFRFYDAISYNTSTYDSNYKNGATVVPTAGKEVPLTPDWLEKFILSTNFGAFEAQINGDYVGHRYATYLNDIRLGGTFVAGLEASYVFDDLQTDKVQDLKLSVNLTNIADVKGFSTVAVTGPSGGFQAYPLSPRMVFVTLGASL
jgi:iron complex outermembrane recepter protein